LTHFLRDCRREDDNHCNLKRMVKKLGKLKKKSVLLNVRNLYRFHGLIERK
jgi:hypothetical protein